MGWPRAPVDARGRGDAAGERVRTHAGTARWCVHGANYMQASDGLHFTPGGRCEIHFFVIGHGQRHQRGIRPWLHDVVTFGEAMIRLSPPELPPAGAGAQPRRAGRRRGAEHRRRPGPAGPLGGLGVAADEQSARPAHRQPRARGRRLAPSTSSGPTTIASACTSSSSAPRRGPAACSTTARTPPSPRSSRAWCPGAGCSPARSGSTSPASRRP